MSSTAEDAEDLLKQEYGKNFESILSLDKIDLEGPLSPLDYAYGQHMIFSQKKRTQKTVRFNDLLEIFTFEPMPFENELIIINKCESESNGDSKTASVDPKTGEADNLKKTIEFYIQVLLERLKKTGYKMIDDGKIEKDFIQKVVTIRAQDRYTWAHVIMETLVAPKFSSLHFGLTKICFQLDVEEAAEQARILNTQMGKQKNKA